jgi:hypothetical protein
MIWNEKHVSRIALNSVVDNENKLIGDEMNVKLGWKLTMRAHISDSLQDATILLLANGSNSSLDCNVQE